MTLRPNFLVIVTDQQRADTLGCYGSSVGRTPFVDALAATAVRFEYAFTTYPVCTPARATMWTGLYPHAHGIDANVVGTDDRLAELDPRPATLFEPMRRAGYRLGYFGKWHLGEGDPGLFDVWSGFNSLGGHWVDGRQSFQGGVYLPDLQTDELLAFLAEDHGDRPFLAVISYYPPHDPFTAPERFYEPYRGRVPFAGYYAAVSALDWNVGRLVDELEKTGLRDDTVVFFFSDHGETFGYRGPEHKFVCTDDAIRVPFLVSWPGHVEPGAVRHAFAGVQDLMPTILDCASCPPPSGLQGRSLRPWFRGRPDAWRDVFFVENHTYRERVQQRAIRTLDHKLILDGNGDHRLFDLKTDPEEELNIFGAPKDDSHRQFAHYPDQRPRVRQLATLLKREALTLDDAVGIDLADRVIR